MKPTVLITTTSRWVPTARLAVALTKAGFAVKAVGPDAHPLSQTTSLDEFYPYRGVAALSSFRTAIAASNPDLIVPGDDLATQHLHQLYAQAAIDGGEAHRIRTLIEHSLGDGENFPIIYSRSRFIQVAQEEGIRCPQTEVIDSEASLVNFADRFGLPLVLKANVTSGGEGVRVVRSMEEAKREFRSLSAPPLLTRALKRAVVDSDYRLILPALERRRPVVNAQSFVVGRESTSLAACWQGKVLASLHFEVLQKTGAAGPASVLRLIENADMAAAVEKSAQRLGLSGLHGFDFMLEEGTGDAYLIEINPRTTQVGHLTLGAGRDLPAALYAAATGEALRAAEKLTDGDTIALFPQEWLRDRESSYLMSAYHDVPWDESKLVKACVEARNKNSGWYTRRADATAFQSLMSAAPKNKAGKLPVTARTPASVSVVIVVWNAQKYVMECLGSLREKCGAVYNEVIVIDNASTDGTPDLIAEHFPEFRLIRNHENAGFGRANNIGMAQASGEFVCLVNSDVKFTDNCISPMLDYMAQHTNVAMMGPKMLDAEGIVRRSTMRFPTVWNNFSRALGLDLIFKHSGFFGGLLMADFDHQRTVPVEVLNGWFVLVRHSALDRVGGFDPQFFMYGEDVDWCYRFHEAGYQSVFFAEAEAIHYGGASSSNAPVRFYLELYRATLQYWRKHHNWLAQQMFLASLMIYHGGRAVGFGIRLLLQRGNNLFKLKRSLACLQWAFCAMWQKENPGRVQPALTT